MIPYIVILSAFYRSSSLVECNPISPILVTWSQFAFRKDFFYLAVFVSKPCIVPASAHIQIESMSNLIGTQAFHKELVCHHLIRLDDAQFTILLTQCPIDVPVILHLCANRPDCAILDNQQLAESHFPSICFCGIVSFPHKLPFAFAPDESSCISLTTIALLHFPIANMIICNVRMFELI